MPGPTLRQPIAAKWIRLAAALLEAGLLVAAGAMFLSGSIQDTDTDGPRIPIRVGLSVIPILVVAFLYAVQRIVKPRRFAFMIAGALVCALGAALCAGLEPIQRLIDALRGFAVGAIAMGFLMSIDDEGTSLLEGEANPWRELFMGTLLVTFGAMPSAIYGGFVLALPVIFIGIGFLVRCIRYDARVVVPRRSFAAACRVFLAILFVLLALGFLVVLPMVSLGMKTRYMS